jgi:hypothetical protein
MVKVMWQPPAHQSLYAPDHPTGHGCALCTVTYEPSVIAHRMTRRGAQRKADRMNDWTLIPGWFYPEQTKGETTVTE